MVKGIFTFLDLFVRVCFKGKEKKKKKFIEKWKMHFSLEDKTNEEKKLKTNVT